MSAHGVQSLKSSVLPPQTTLVQGQLHSLFTSLAGKGPFDMNGKNLEKLTGRDSLMRSGVHFHMTKHKRMGSSAVRLHSDWHDDYFFGGLDPTLWLLLCHFLVSSVPVWHAQHGISFSHAGPVEQISCDSLGITLESPEVTASTLQQTNSSL